MKESPQFKNFIRTKEGKSIKRESSPDEENKEELDISQYDRAIAIQQAITPELRTGYIEIFKKLKPNNEGTLVEIESHEEEIETWINNLLANARNSDKYKDWDEDDFEGLQAESWNFFESIVRIVNTKIIEDEVKHYLPDGKKEEKLDRDERLDLHQEAQEKIAIKFGITKAESAIIVDLVAMDLGQREYSLSDVAIAMKKIWQEYEMIQQTTAITKVASGRLLQQLVDSTKPYLFTKLLPESGGINMAIFFEMFGLTKLSEIIDIKTSIMQNQVIRDIEKKMNTRTAEYMFYSDFENMDESTLGKTINTIKRGMSATIGLIRECTEHTGPTVAGIGMSAAFLSSIQPMMGVIGISSLPVIYAIAKKHSKERRVMYKQRKEKTDAIETRLSGVKNSMEEIMTSPHTENTADEAEKLLEEQSDVLLKSANTRQWQYLKEEIPLDVSHILSLATGYVLYQQGLINAGAVLSNTQYVAQLQRPVQGMLRTLMDDLSQNIQDIDEMEKLFGKYEDLDRPNSKKEETRIPASSRQHNGIKIDGLSTRGILDNINLNVSPGETVIIRGPSGVGKTTLLRAIAGLYKPTSGEVLIGGNDSRNYKKFGPDSIRSILAYTTQKPVIIPDMTLRENLTMWSKPDATDEEIFGVFSKLNLTNLVPRLNNKTKLSGGELVRFGLARVLLRNPQILLLDEPTASLDSETSTEIIKLIQNLKTKNPEITIVCVSHDPNLASLGREIELKKNSGK